MKLSQLIGQRIKDTPKDAALPSHIFLLRGGYMRPVAAGIYSLLPLGKRVLLKIERIIREEMDRVGGQEVQLPVVLPADLWRESGRYDSVGPELLRFSNRNESDMVLGMTHEEAVVALARTEANSYKQLPFMLYQIQTKYRDEARPRGGLVRVREFTMKDAYSFHASEDDLRDYYERVYESYRRIFTRIGLNDVVIIEADSGMMGGAVSHEYMAVSETGEDTLFMNKDRTYLANREVAATSITFEKPAPAPLKKVHTPGQETIAEVTAFLSMTGEQACKAVFFKVPEGPVVMALIRGDIDVNETKLRNYLQAPQLPAANDEEITAIGAVPGYASPVGLKASDRLRIIVDPSVARSGNLIAGANEADYHYINFNADRDLEGGEEIDIATARDGDPCPVSGTPLQMRRGIEIGNIFQLGTKYSQAMECVFNDENGKTRPMIMGCYGIGLERTMAAVIEQCHDQYGPVWPRGIAPFQVHICALNPKRDQTGETAERLYREFQDRGVEVLLDDRGEKAGFTFNDADLIGAPLRLIVSPKTLADNQVEFKTRDGSLREMLPVDGAVDAVMTRLNSQDHVQ
jgi:prolyl-tRNA synthetase